jgi:hypothetical protein
MKKNVDFSIFVGPQGSYGVVTGMLDVPVGLKEGDIFLIPSGVYGNAFPAFEGFDGRLKVEKLVSGAGLGIEDAIMLEDVVLCSREDAERLAHYLESELDLFVMHNMDFT